jgi:hypothetical protein
MAMIERDPAGRSKELRASAAAQLLLADHTTARLMQALRERGLQALLIKGPSTDRWLYAPDAVRLYGDVDVVVAPDAYVAAERALSTVGFVNRYDGSAPPWAEEHADMWVSDRWPLPVDLHRRLWGFEAPAGDVWQALWASREALSLEAGDVLVPGVAERFLITVLHAAHHVTAEKPLEDLRRALLRVDDATAARGAALARQLQALNGFAAGLDLQPEGRALRERLGLADVDAHMRHVHPLVWDAPATAEGFLRLADARGLRAKAALARRELLPSATFMRLQSTQRDVAARGRGGLVAAYVLRWVELARTSVSGASAAWHVRRSRR